MDYIIRTLQSHHLGHCECTEYFLDQENCKEIGLENYECTSSAQVGIWVGTLSMSLQCICSVPVQYTTLCPQWVWVGRLVSHSPGYSFGYDVDSHWGWRGTSFWDPPVHSWLTRLGSADSCSSRERRASSCRSVSQSSTCLSSTRVPVCRSPSIQAVSVSASRPGTGPSGSLYARPYPWNTWTKAYKSGRMLRRGWIGWGSREQQTSLSTSCRGCGLSRWPRTKSTRSCSY